MSLGTHRCEQAAAQLLSLGGFFSAIFSVHFGIFLSFVDLNLKYISSHVVLRLP